MGAGKSTAARDAARLRGGDAIDSDALVEDRLGRSIQVQFERPDGEREFRRVEEDVVCDLLAAAPRGATISLGGGSVISERVREALRDHTTVLLEVDAERAWRRARPAAGPRPLARNREAFGALHAKRLPLYEALADAFLPAHGGRGVVGRALGALEALEGAPRGSRLVWARAASGEYPVLAGPGILAANVWPLSQQRRFLVSDANVQPLYGERLEPFAASIEIPPGEQSKTLARAEQVLRELARADMTREDYLVALGGGVVGDLAGFCAATYQRGVAVVHVPTSLLAQVDSAYGGKTGVDLPEAKNYVGAYHQPAAVLVDHETLATLSAHELAAGYAELLKTALIAGGELWRRVAADEPLDPSLVLACARCKLEIVAADERDASRRQQLNLGHTVAHAIETATDYRRYRHGEAVALGLLAALRLSGQGELREQVMELLRSHGLPTELDADPAAVVLATQRDKKRAGGKVGFVLLDAPGALRVGCTVSQSELEAAVRELRLPAMSHGRRHTP
ncbi:MAG: bifunctional shikimate kinase/3-dehydroquinate synthase [Solirubrobacteraceae bacterium]